MVIKVAEINTTSDLKRPTYIKAKIFTPVLKYWSTNLHQNHAKLRTRVNKFVRVVNYSVYQYPMLICGHWDWDKTKIRQ